jgi:5-methylcytosine-specific restriction endonuclease McrA
VQRTCEKCERNFNSKRNRTRCGRRACNLDRTSGVLMVCEGCDLSVRIPPSQVAGFRFCSISCAYKTRMIGNNYSAGIVKSTSFVSDQIMGSDNPSWKEPVERLCEFCAGLFYLKPGEINDKHAGRFCSRYCFTTYKSLYESGENAPDWEGGPSSFRGRGWPQIRLQVVIEQCGHCGVCARFVGASMPVHHIKPFREFDDPDEANVRSNLIGVCQSCHMKLEPRRFGRTVETTILIPELVGSDV